MAMEPFSFSGCQYYIYKARQQGTNFRNCRQTDSIGLSFSFGLSSGSAGGVKAVTTVASSATGLAGFGAAMLGTLWAYDGWIGVTNIAGELKNPGKDLPKAIIFGLSAIIIVYVLFNTALINVVPAESLMGSEKPATDVSVALFGDAGAALIAGGIMVSIFGALNGYLMTGFEFHLPWDKEDSFRIQKNWSSKRQGSNTGERPCA